MNSRLFRDRVLVPAIGVLCSLALAACGDSGSSASSASEATGTAAISGTLPVAGGSGSSPLSATDDGGGSALVTWSAPQVNDDGSMLTDLTGFNIYYGQDPANLNQVVQLVCTTCVWQKVSNLGQGTWYFEVRAYNSVGLEGEASPMVNKTIG